MPLRSALLAAAALLLLVAACAPDKPKSATRATQAPVETSVALRPSATPAAAAAGPAAPFTVLARALLPLGEMPPGYKTMDESSTQGDVDTTRYCDVTRTYRVIERARAQFGQGPQDPVIYHVVATFAPGEAQRGLDETRELFRTCSAWKETAQDGAVTSYRAALLPLAGLGDQTLAFRMDIESKEATTQITVVQVRRGDSTSSLLYASVGKAAPDMTLIERLARRGDERLAALVNGR